MNAVKYRYIAPVYFSMAKIAAIGTNANEYLARMRNAVFSILLKKELNPKIVNTLNAIAKTIKGSFGIILLVIAATNAKTPNRIKKMSSFFMVSLI